MSKCSKVRCGSCMVEREVAVEQSVRHLTLEVPVCVPPLRVSAEAIQMISGAILLISSHARV